MNGRYTGVRKHEEGREHGEDSGRVSSEGLCSDYSSLLPADSSGHKPESMLLLACKDFQ